ncbi:MAG: hypothetical protein M3Z09_13765, partial [Acidobacteriota bacterium]|nr:hypothetical protein [Acidobacteriota bacterium]
TELILRDGFVPNDLNLQISQRISVALVFVVMGFAMMLAIYWRGYFLTPLFTVLFVLLSRYWLAAMAGPKPRVFVAAILIVIAIIIALAYRYHMLGLIPLMLVGSLLIFLRHRYAASNMRTLQRTGVVIGSFVALTILVAVTYLPYSVFAFAFVFLLLILVIINTQFYVFLAGTRGKLFALAGIPFHILYHFYNGISFIAGLIRHLSRRNSLSKSAPPRSSVPK